MNRHKYKRFAAGENDYDANIKITVVFFSKISLRDFLQIGIF